MVKLFHGNGMFSWENPTENTHPTVFTADNITAVIMTAIFFFFFWYLEMKIYNLFIVKLPGFFSQDFEFYIWVFSVWFHYYSQCLINVLLHGSSIFLRFVLNFRNLVTALDFVINICFFMFFLVFLSFSVSFSVMFLYWSVVWVVCRWCKPELQYSQEVEGILWWFNSVQDLRVSLRQYY